MSQQLKTQSCPLYGLRGRPADVMTGNNVSTASEKKDKTRRCDLVKKDERGDSTAS